MPLTAGLVSDDSDHMRVGLPIAIGIALTLGASSAYSQQPTFRAGVDLVKVDVSISRGGEHISGLKAENFAVFDNGVQQKISTVTLEQVPLEAYLVLDTSGSVQGAKLEQLKQAAGAFVDGLVPRDTAALLTFAQQVTVRQPLTGDLQSFRRALAEVTSGGQTALYDAVSKALSLREPRDNRAIVVVFTDDHDNASTATSKQVVDAAERSDVIVYGVMAADNAGARGPAGGIGLRSPQFQFQIGFLRSLADGTGGRVFRAGIRLPLEDVFGMVLDDARSRYVLTYSPDKTTPGWHKLSVKLVGVKGDVVARRGYVVSKAAAGSR
jgi:Ca-activated chloride channel family protein